MGLTKRKGLALEKVISCKGTKSRYFEVEQSGEVKSDDKKTLSNKIKLIAEIGITGLVKAHIDWVFSKIKKSKKKHNTGNRSTASNTGDKSAASNTGYMSSASNTGYMSAASNTGNRSVASNTGYMSAASNTGYMSTASNTGDMSAASNTGNMSAASNTGDRSAASNTGNSSIAVAWGIKSKAMISDESSYMVLSDWRENKDFNWYLHKAHMVKIGDKLCRNKIKANTWYWFEKGKLKKEIV